MTDEKNPIHQPREFRHGSGSRIPETGEGSGSVEGPPEQGCTGCYMDRVRPDCPVHGSRDR